MSKYIEQYPWLRLRSLYTGELYEKIDAYDEILEGWQTAFGEMLLKDLDTVIKTKNLQDEFVFEQVKEKFGQLVMYVNTADQDVHRVLDKYYTLSANICAHCGKPDVSMLRMNWIIPLCEDCYNKMNYRDGTPRKNAEPYESITTEDNTMPDKMKTTRWTRTLLGENMTIETEIDISKTAQVIRENYEKRIDEKAKSDE